MTSAHKPFAPSSSRMAFAASKGLFVRSPLFIFGAVLLLTAGLGLFKAPEAIDAFSAYLASALRTSSPQALLYQSLKHLLVATLLLSIAPCIVAGVAVWMVRYQKGPGRSAVPLPKPFGTFRDNLLLVVLGLFILLPMAIWLVRLGQFNFAEIEHTPGLTAKRLVNTVFRLLLAGGGVCILLGVLQLSLYKIRLFKHLSLTAFEQNKEQRLHGRSNTKEHIHTSSRQD